MKWERVQKNKKKKVKKQKVEKKRGMLPLRTKINNKAGFKEEGGGAMLCVCVKQ